MWENFSAEDILHGAASLPNTTFLQAVVIDVINDPAAFRSSASADIINEVNFKHWISRAPRNSIIARILNAGRGKKGKAFICLPFFPPHLCFPIKPGEHVWLISPTAPGTSVMQYYWMCRVPSYVDVDDINYTSDSRWLSYGIPKEKKSSGEDDKAGQENNELLFGFPNGSGLKEGTQNISGGVHAYADLINNSFAIKSFKFEPVPRLTKRPGDFVIQGSNNASITLGTSRGEKGGWTDAANPDQNRFSSFKGTPKKIFKEDKETYVRSNATQTNPVDDPPVATDHANTHGAIDIVVGRSLRVRKTATSPVHAATDSKVGTDSSMASLGHPAAYPRVKKTNDPKDSDQPLLDDSKIEGPSIQKMFSNTVPAELIEVSKNPLAFDNDVEQNHFDNPIEGDPDFRYDAARIYITADSEPDRDFGLDNQIGPAGKIDNIPLSPPAADDQPHPLAGSSIVSKADHIRIIARKDPDQTPLPFSAGSIRIIKEGPIPSVTLPKTPPDNAPVANGERALIAIEPNGTIYIDGPKIVLGNARITEHDPADGTGGIAHGQHVYIGGEQAVESAVLGESFADAILAFATDVATMLGGSAAGALNHSGMSSSRTSPPTQGILPSTGNMGTPLANPTAQLALDALKKNLTLALSKTTKLK